MWSVRGDNIKAKRVKQFAAVVHQERQTRTLQDQPVLAAKRVKLNLRMVRIRVQRVDLAIIPTRKGLRDAKAAIPGDFRIFGVAKQHAKRVDSDTTHRAQEIQVVRIAQQENTQI